MGYEVIKAFTDSNANSADETGQKHMYWEGDSYPFKQYAGATTKLRLKELTSGGYIKELTEEDDGRKEEDSDNSED